MLSEEEELLVNKYKIVHYGLKLGIAMLQIPPQISH